MCQPVQRKVDPTPLGISFYACLVIATLGCVCGTRVFKGLGQGVGCDIGFFQLPVVPSLFCIILHILDLVSVLSWGQ